MLPNIRNGTSFFGAGLYYLHDKREEGELECLTNARVEWTHTHNLAVDDPQLALREMATTAARQQMLKDAAGRGHGSYVDEVVKTISLSWDHGEQISKQDMIKAGESFLEYMKWSDHQALFVCHNDTKHQHIHIILNKIHPETGIKLNEWEDERRSQKWALAYEKEQGLVRCKDRQAIHEQGAEIEPCGVPQPEHKAWKRNAVDLDQQLEFQRRQDAAEWDLLKQAQRDERDAYWAETKGLIRTTRSQIYREVREEFREQWADYFKMKEGCDSPEQAAQAEALKQQLVEARREATNQRQQEAIDALLKDRREAYDQLKVDQKEERQDLRRDQANGTTRYDLLNQAYPVNRPAEPAQQPVAAAFQNAEHEITRLADERPATPFRGQLDDADQERQGYTPGILLPTKDPISALCGGLLGLADRLADSLSGSAPTIDADQYAALKAARAVQDEFNQLMERNRQQSREEAEREAERERARERSHDRER